MAYRKSAERGQYKEIGRVRFQRDPGAWGLMREHPSPVEAHMRRIPQGTQGPTRISVIVCASEGNAQVACRCQSPIGKFNAGQRIAVGFVARRECLGTVGTCTVLVCYPGLVDVADENLFVLRLRPGGEAEQQRNTQKKPGSGAYARR